MAPLCSPVPRALPSADHPPGWSRGGETSGPPALGTQGPPSCCHRDKAETWKARGRGTEPARPPPRGMAWVGVRLSGWWLETPVWARTPAPPTPDVCAPLAVTLHSSPSLHPSTGDTAAAGTTLSPLLRAHRRCWEEGVAFSGKGGLAAPGAAHTPLRQVRGAGEPGAGLRSVGSSAWRLRQAPPRCSQPLGR